MWEAEGDPTKYSLDTNDDGTVDLSDFVGGRNWFFSGGEAPWVCLDTKDLEASLAQVEGNLQSTQENLNTCQQTASDLQASLVQAQGERDAANEIADAAAAALADCLAPPEPPRVPYTR